jgi:hypothetical protein
MVQALFMSVLLASANASPSPAPLPTLPPLIEHTVTSSTCTALRKYFGNIGYVTRRNDEAFGAMARSVRTFVAGIYPSDVPSAAELVAAQNSTGDGDNGTSADQVGGPNEDDTLIYGPGQILNAARIETVANEIYANLVLEGKIMNESWKEYPAGTDPHIDALRQHLQNMMDLQRGLADKYETFAGTYLSNNGMATLRDPGSEVFFKLYLRALLLGDVSELQETGQDAVTNDGFTSERDRERLGTVADLVKGLRDEERAYAPAVLQTMNQCNGTNYVINGSSPEPSASP